MTTEPTTIEGFRASARVLHARASAGCPKSIAKLAELMRHKRRHELKPAKSTREHSDEKIYETLRANKGSRIMTAAMLGYSYSGLLKRLRPILKARMLKNGNDHRAIR